MRTAALFALIGLVTCAPPGVAQLPMVALAPAAAPSHTLAILITGDGGWAATDRAIGKRLTQDGDGVMVLNSLHYFTAPRTPAGVAADVGRLARDGCARWSCDRIVLIGYSMGADVLPFVVDRLSSDVRPRTVELVLISLSHKATFRFLPTEWLGLNLWPTVATLPELARVHGVQVVCIFGTRDQDSACRDLAPGQATLISVPGGHVMTDVADQLAELIAAHVRALARPTPPGESRARGKTITGAWSGRP